MKDMIRKLKFQITVEPEKRPGDLFDYVLEHDPEPEVIETTEAIPEALQEAAAWLKTKRNERIGNRITVYAVEHFTADDDGEFISGSDYDTAGEGKDEDMTLERWATENGLEATYRQYSADVDAMADALEEQGLPSNGSTYEALLEGIRSCYPELFGEDGEDPDDDLDPDKQAMVRNHKRYEKWEQTEAARAFMEEHLPPEKYQEYLRDRFEADENPVIYLDTANLQAYTDSRTIDLPPRYRERVQAIMDNEELDPEDREQMLRQIEADLEADPKIIEALR